MQATKRNYYGAYGYPVDGLRGLGSRRVAGLGGEFGPRVSDTLRVHVPNSYILWP